MSEKQFKLLSGGFDEKGNPLYRIKDTDMIGDYEICNKVIEQQSTIQSLQNKNIILKNRIEDLKTSIHFQDKELQRLLQQSKGSVKR